MLWINYQINDPTRWLKNRGIWTSMPLQPGHCEQENGAQGLCTGYTEDKPRGVWERRGDSIQWKNRCWQRRVRKGLPLLQVCKNCVDWTWFGTSEIPASGNCEFEVSWVTQKLAGQPGIYSKTVSQRKGKKRQKDPMASWKILQCFYLWNTNT